MTDIKRLPSMQMEKYVIGTDLRVKTRIAIKNDLRMQILSELTKKPTVNKGKIGKDDQLLEELKQ